MEERIPKIIHQVWIQGEQNIPEKFIANIKKIKKMHSDWTYILWDEISILQLLKNTNVEWYANYYKFNYLHQKVDYAKLIILFIYGGISIDIDAYTIKKLDTLYDKYDNYDLIVSYIKDINFIVNIFVCRRFTQCLNNGIFLGKPNTDILKYMIDKISYDCAMLDNKITCISNTTGPIYFHKHIFKYINSQRKKKSTIIILDNEYLEPCTLDDCNVTKNTYIKHEHNLSWLNVHFKNIIWLYFKYKMYVHVLLLLLFMWLFWFIKNRQWKGIFRRRNR
jgi:mannosyltransferase OCH1-like enzyme